jgi:hypothetical protein
MITLCLIVRERLAEGARAAVRRHHQARLAHLPHARPAR